MWRKSITIFLLLVGVFFKFGTSYSAIADARAIKEYRRQLLLNTTRSGLNLDHPKIARRLVHQAEWAAVGTISTDKTIKDYPMVNIISINDNDESGKSTGHIQFLLTDLDFTGADWQQDNKVTMLFSDEQLLHCTRASRPIDPMEPTCARTIISGKVVKMDEKNKDYKNALAAFIQRHTAAKNWLKAHNFYLCELDITNIFALDFYGGAHNISPADYYKVSSNDL